jgi:hypothetical protein
MQYPVTEMIILVKSTAKMIVPTIFFDKDIALILRTGIPTSGQEHVLYILSRAKTVIGEFMLILNTDRGVFCFYKVAVSSDKNQQDTLQSCHQRQGDAMPQGVLWKDL